MALDLGQSRHRPDRSLPRNQPCRAAIIAFGSTLLELVSADTELSVFMAYFFVLGIGLGAILQPLALAIQNALPPEGMGISTASGMFFRQLGGTLGVAVFLSVLFGELPGAVCAELDVAAGTPEFQQAVAQSMRDPSPAEATLAQAWQTGDASGPMLQDSSVVQQLDPTLAAPFRSGFAEAFTTVSPLVFVLGLVSLALLIVWKEVPLRDYRPGTPPRPWRARDAGMSA